MSNTDNYPPDWRRRARAIYKRDGYTCQNCGAQGGPFGSTELHAHHIVNVASGGIHEPSNLVTLCRECHTATHNPGIAAPTASRKRAPDQSNRTWSERNGRWWMHALLLLFTLGIGNIVYWWSRRRSRDQGRGGLLWRALRFSLTVGVVSVLLLWRALRYTLTVCAANAPLLRRSLRFIMIVGAALVLLSTGLVVPVGIGYAGLAVGQNRHDAFNHLQNSKLSRLPGLDRDSPDWVAGTMTVIYLLALLVLISLMF